MDGRVAMLRSRLFPLGTKRRDDDIHDAIYEMEKKKLVISYSFNEKPYLQVTKWQRCGKREDSHFPWKDGSHRIEYVTRETRDGPKSFVSTSILGSAPHADGVTTETNTDTDTKTETKTKPPKRGGRGPDDGDLPYNLNADEIPDSLKTYDFIQLWPQWVAQRSKKRGGLNRRSARMQLKDCEEWGPEKAVRALKDAIGGNWQGLHEPSRVQFVSKPEPNSFVRIEDDDETIDRLIDGNGGKP